MVAFADLILPDTTYLERHDCISLLDRPISEPEALCDSIRWPVVEPDRDVRGFQSVLLDLGARLKLPGMVNGAGKPVYKDYADYIVNHQRKPGVGPLSGWRGENGDKTGRGEPNPDQLDRYIENGGFSMVHVPEEAQFFKHANRAWSDWAIAHGLQDGPVENIFQLYLEPLRKFQLAAEGKIKPSRPRIIANGSSAALTRCLAGIRHFTRMGLKQAPIRCTRSRNVPRRCTIPGVRRMPG
jgi:anaerobic selenocysteine-containing dehydrogenase